jgi:predicted ATPase/DNA-binding CsgD family transcriptional regulator
VQRDDIRLLTLTGPGGVGKTRLALHIAADVGGAFADGVQFVDLASITKPDLVAPTIAHVLGVRDTGGSPVADRLSVFLRAKSLLLVLDNFEQVVEAAPFLSSLLGACPNVLALVTSRVRLRVSGEHEYVVPPLGLVAPDTRYDVDELARSAAVRLLVERAQAVTDSFSLTPDNASAVAEICRRVDGLPLAIELAAARIKILPPAALLARLDQRLPVLSGGNRDLPARQQTMRATLAWSYDLLSAAEQRLFRRLSVFVDGFALAAAEAVVGLGSRAPESLDLVASLVDKSLLRQEPGLDGEPRFRMLETAREFGLEQVIANGEEAAVRGCHAAWYLALATAAGPLVRLGGEPERLSQLSAEHGNLRDALGWLAARGDAEGVARLSGALHWFWHMGGHGCEGSAWLERALAAGAATSPAARIGALSGASNLAVQQGDHARARALAAESLALARVEGDRVAEAENLFLLSRAASQQGAATEATEFATEAAALNRALGDERALPWALQRLGIEAFAAGDWTEAAAFLAEALAGFRAVANPLGVAYASGSLGLAWHLQGDRRQAAALFRESLLLHRELADPYNTAHTLVHVALLATEAGDVARAARILGAADGLFAATGTARLRYLPEIEDRAQAEARSRLGPKTYVAMWETGRALSFADAIEEGLAAIAAGGGDALPARSSAETASDGLTTREREVLRHLIAGRSNAEIAAALFVSRRTITTHVSRLYAKLGVSSRAEAIAFTHRHELV